MSVANSDHVEGRTPSESGLYLKLANPKGEGPSLQFPVLVKSLSAGGVILEAYQPPVILDPANLQGRPGTIRPASGNGIPEIAGTVQWARLEGSGPDFFLGLELADPTVETRRVLEAHLPITTRDLKELWDRWDQVQNPAPAVASASSQGIYLVCLGAVLGGVALCFLGPENMNFFGLLLIIYGSLTLAVKSVWAILRERVMSSRNGDRMKTGF